MNSINISKQNNLYIKNSLNIILYSGCGRSYFRSYEKKLSNSNFQSLKCSLEAKDL